MLFCEAPPAKNKREQENKETRGKQNKQGRPCFSHLRAHTHLAFHLLGTIFLLTTFLAANAPCLAAPRGENEAPEVPLSSSKYEELAPAPFYVSKNQTCYSFSTKELVDALANGCALPAPNKKDDTTPEIPSTFPTNGTISAPFGSRYSAFLHRRELHKGIDIRANPGTPVTATAKGTVIRSLKTPRYGNCVDIDHCNGLVTRYAHMQKNTVHEGDKVSCGDIIGYVGSSGLSSGPHLHYEVRSKGVPVNPAKYMKKPTANEEKP